MKIVILKQYFVNLCEIKVCRQTWAYFIWELGWLRIFTGKNMGPQNNMHLPLLVLLSGMTTAFTNRGSTTNLMNM